MCSLTHHKNGYILTFDQASIKIAEFFSLFGTLHSQITLKEIAYILASFQARFTSAYLFYFSG